MKVRILLYVGVATAALSVFWYQDWQMSKLEGSVLTLTENNAKLETALSNQHVTIEAFQLGLEQAFENNEKLSIEIRKSDIQRKKIIQELTSYRGRLHNAALKKPGIIERRVNSSTSKLLQQFAAETERKE